MGFLTLSNKGHINTFKVKKPIYLFHKKMCIETDAKNIIVPENGLYKSPQSLHNTYNLYETW